MKTGDSARTYTTNETHYVVEGFSESEERYVYPCETWSYTSWQPYISKTYKSPEAAAEDITYGYLFDMIESQKVVNIRIYGITTVTEHDEKKRIVSFDQYGKPIDHVEPVYTTATAEITARDLVILDRIPNGHGLSYARVLSIRDGKMVVDVINGGYEFSVDLTVTPHVVHNESRHVTPGDPVYILHIGRPDPGGNPDYNHQLGFYRDHFYGQPIPTSTKLGIPHVDQVDENGEASAFDQNDTFFNPPEKPF